MSVDPRVRGLSAAITSLAAVACFAWARADASWPARLVLEVLGVVGLVVAFSGLVLAASRLEHVPVPVDVRVRRRVLRICLCVAGLVVAGAGALAAIGFTVWIPAWVSAGTGVYLIASGRVLETPFLGLVGVFVMGSSAAAAVSGANTSVAPGLVAGLSAGTCLLVAALGSVVAATIRRRRGGRLGSLTHE
jgi:hypothetical protein